jgi:hypothetical protein
MPSLEQFAERIIDLTHTRGPGSAGIAVMTADAYLVAFEASQIGASEVDRSARK